MKTVGRTILISLFDAPLPLKRAYCTQELYHTKVSNSKFNIITSTKKQNYLERATHLFTASVVESISNVDVAEAECRSTEEKNMILSDLRRHNTLIQCNKEVIELLENELIDQGQKALRGVAKTECRTSILIENIAMLLQR